MRILILNTDYSGFLQRFYRDNPGLQDKSYAEQCAARNDTLFGFADFYPRNFEKHGHISKVIYVDNLIAQSAWGREHGFDVPMPQASHDRENPLLTWLRFQLAPYKSAFRPLAARMGLLSRLDDRFRDILLAQIEDFEPDVIMNQNMRVMGSDLMRMIRKPSRKLVVQIGVEPPREADLSVYDLGISLIPAVVQYFRSQKLRAEEVDLAFEPSVLEKLGPAPQKDIPVSFVGSISPAHSSRIAFLEAIAAHYPLSLWVPSLAGIPASSRLYACRQGEVYGRQMYEVLRRSQISLNSHIADARGSAGNLRVYEATGVGSMLLTDDLPDLKRLFDPDIEVATYKSTGNCIEQIGRFLSDARAREERSAAGQQRALRDHTFFDRTQQLLGYFENL